MSRSVAKTIIMVTGLPGSGKTVFSKVAETMGIPVFRMGDVLREYAVEKGLDTTDETLGRLSLELRERYGRAVIAERTFEKIMGTNADIVVVEGLRNVEEFFFFREKAQNTVLVAIHASPNTRYARLRERGRSDDPSRWEDFLTRDQRELNLGLGTVIALSDIILINDGKTIETFMDECRVTLRKLLARSQGLST
jgi:dephospho-CoA kinase